jgi:hypothetical protein
MKKKDQVIARISIKDCQECKWDHSLEEIYINGKGITYYICPLSLKTVKIERR